MFINFKANGNLIGAVEQLVAGDFIVLVYWKGEYVVSQYINGLDSWVSGKYFQSLTQATEEFCRMVTLYCS